jgi:uncharacterized repeat protein (TIGR01451 family)
LLLEVLCFWVFLVLQFFLQKVSLFWCRCKLLRLELVLTQVVIPDECLNNSARDFSGNRKSVLRSANVEHYCSDLEVVTNLVDSNLSVADRSVVYRTTVTNHGPHTAQSIHVKGNIPKNFIATSWSGDTKNGSYSLERDDYFIKNLQPGETTFINLVVDVSSVSCGFIHDNTAFVEAFAGLDYNTANNIDKERLAVPVCSKWDKIYSI